MRVVALHEDVLLCTSAFWQTNCTVVRGTDREAPEAFVIDSPVLPDELEALPGVLEHTGWPCSGLLRMSGWGLTCVTCMPNWTKGKRNRCDFCAIPCHKCRHRSARLHSNAPKPFIAA